MQTNNLETQTSSPPNQIAHDLLPFISTHSLQSSSMIAPHHFHLLYTLSLPSAVLIFYFKELTRTLLSWNKQNLVSCRLHGSSYFPSLRPFLYLFFFHVLFCFQVLLIFLSSFIFCFLTFLINVVSKLSPISCLSFITAPSLCLLHYAHFHDTHFLLSSTIPKWDSQPVISRPELIRINAN